MALERMLLSGLSRFCRRQANDCPPFLAVNMKAESQAMG